MLTVGVNEGAPGSRLVDAVSNGLAKLSVGGG